MNDFRIDKAEAAHRWGAIAMEGALIECYQRAEVLAKKRVRHAFALSEIARDAVEIMTNAIIIDAPWYYRGGGDYSLQVEMNNPVGSDGCRTMIAISTSVIRITRDVEGGLESLMAAQDVVESMGSYGEENLHFFMIAAGIAFGFPPLVQKMTANDSVVEFARADLYARRRIGMEWDFSCPASVRLRGETESRVFTVHPINTMLMAKCLEAAPVDFDTAEFAMSGRVPC